MIALESISASGYEDGEGDRHSIGSIGIIGLRCASIFRGAGPPVDFFALCLVLAISNSH